MVGGDNLGDSTASDVTTITFQGTAPDANSVLVATLFTGLKVLGAEDIALAVETQQATDSSYYQIHLLNFITLSWSTPQNPTGVFGYLVGYSVGGVANGETILENTVTTITFQDNNLQGRNYIDPNSAFVAHLDFNQVEIPNTRSVASPPPQNVIPSPPVSATIQRTSDTSYTISWSSPGNVDGYVISYADGAVVNSLELPADRTSEQIQNLQPNTDYQFNLYSQRNGIRAQASLTVLPPVVTPPENTIVAIDDRGEDFINIVWDHDPTQGIISYHPTLLRNDGVTLVQDGGLIGAPAGAAPLTHRFTGLDPGTQYTVDINIVASANPNTEIDFASDLAFTRPKPPRNVLLYPLSPTTILFTWERPLPPNDFFIDYLVSASNTDLGFSVENVLPQGATSNAIRGLQPATSYDLSVLTNIEPVTSNFPAFTDVPLTAVAGTVNIGAVTAQELEVLWSTDGIAADSFKVLLFSEDGLEQFEQSVPAGTTSVLFENLTPDTPYIAVVEAIVRNVQTNTDQASVVGSDEATTSIGTSVNLGPVTSSTIALDWTPIPDTIGYQVIYTGPDGQELLDFSTTPYTILTGLNPVSQYDITVRAITNSGLADVGTTTATTDTLVNLVASAQNIQTTSFDIIWEDRPEFTYTSYIATVSEVGGTFSVQLPATANRDGRNIVVNAMGLTPGTEYDVNIQGVTSTGVREDQGNFNVFTGPNPPIDGRFTEINGMTVLLEWNPPDDGRIDGYIVIHGAETQDPTTLVQAIIPVGQTAYAISGLNPTTPYTIGLVSYRNSTDTFSDFAELLQQQNSNFVINRGDNQCASRPCINGGQCYGVSGGSFRCECISGFSGITCAIDTNLNTSSPISTNLSGISTNTMIAVTMSHYTMNPVTSSDATGTLVTTPKLQTTSNYVIYITVAAVVLLILLVLSIILCSRKKTRSSRKKTQDANTEPNLALPLGPLPQRPGSRPYDTKIVTTAPTHGLSNHGQLDVYADIL